MSKPKNLESLVCELPKSKLPASFALDDGVYPFFLSGPKPKSCDEFIFDGKAVVLSTGGNAAVHIGKGKFAYSTDCWALAPDEDQVNPDFLFHWLTSKRDDIDVLGFEGSGLKHLRKDFVRKLAFEAPTMPEQSKIAEILSQVDQAIKQTEALIAKQQHIKTGLMQDLLTRGIDERGNLRSEETHEFKDSPLERIPVDWTLTQIGDVVTLQRGHDITENEFLDGPYPVVSSSGIIGYHTQFTSKGPNVVVGRKGTIGKVHYIDHDFWAHDTSLYVTNFKGNNELYIFYLFNYLDLARYGTKSGSPSLNRNDIHPLWISLPSPDEQKQITNILTGCDQRLSSLNLVLKKTHSLKTALMQDLLTGKKPVTALLEKAP